MTERSRQSRCATSPAGNTTSRLPAASQSRHWRKGARFCALASRRVERVHQNGLAVHFGHAGQKRVGNQFVIRADAIEKRHQDQAFHNSIGMIGHHHGRSSGGEARQISVVEREADVEKL